MSEGSGSSRPRKQTLLQKYGMLLECLSFEHIEKCTNKLELERIIKILRSKEEGHYPELERAAEEKLRKCSPNSHLLRVDDPVIPTSALEPEHRNLVSQDIQIWESEMADRENKLKFSALTSSEEIPAIRNAAVSKAVIDKNKMNKSTFKTAIKSEVGMKSCVPKNYSYWDKFDAESEILKMDLEEEQLSERKEKDVKEQHLKLRLEEQEEEVMSEKIKCAAVGAGDFSSVADKSHNASLERNKGNEYFRTKEYVKALQHYSKSINILPTVDAYNNRSQTYLKLLKYNEAIADAERVLQLDPCNVKGLYRHGVAKFSLKLYQSALCDFEKALEIDPNNKDCQEYVKKAMVQLGISPSSKHGRVRMAIQDITDNKMDEENLADSEDMYYPFFNTSRNENIVLNDIGTAKFMCSCSGTPGFMKKVRSLEDIKEHGRLCLRRSSRSKKRDPKPNSASVGAVPSNLNKTGKDFEKCAKSVGVAHIISQADEKITKEQEKKKKIVSFSPAANSNTNCSVENIKSGYSFSKFWNSIKGPENLDSVSSFLKAHNPEKVKQMVGSMLDDKMLSLFIMALKTHFSLPEDWGIVQRYLQSFTHFPRFKCVSMMLDKSSKGELESLLNEAEGLGLRVSDLLQLYGMTDCPES